MKLVYPHFQGGKGGCFQLYPMFLIRDEFEDLAG